MKKWQEILTWTIFGLMALGMLVPLVYWGFHPEMTEMQVFLKFGWVYIIVVLMYIPLKKLLK